MTESRRDAGKLHLIVGLLLMLAAFLSWRLFLFAVVGLIAGLLLVPTFRFVRYCWSSTELSSVNVLEWLVLVAVVAAGAGMAIPQFSVSAVEFAAERQTRVFEVGYRGNAEYRSEQRLWFVGHFLSVAAAAVDSPATIASDQLAPQHPSLRDALLLEGWAEFARGQDSVYLEMTTIHGGVQPRFPTSQILSIPIPTLGERVDRSLVLFPRSGSELIVRAPRNVVVESFPRASAREPTLGNDVEVLRIPVDRLVDKEQTAVRLRMADFPLRNPFGNWLLRWTFWKFGGAVTLTLLGILGLELQRRLIAPTFSHLLDRLAVPDYSVQSNKAETGDGTD